MWAVPELEVKKGEALQSVCARAPTHTHTQTEREREKVRKVVPVCNAPYWVRCPPYIRQ
jgi:hypothetical protein